MKVDSGHQGMRVRRKGSYCSVGTVSVWDDQKVLEMDSSDAGTVWMYLVPQNCILIKMVTFMLVYFTTIKRESSSVPFISMVPQISEVE